MQKIYSTDIVPTEEKFDYWREAVCTHLIRAQARPDKKENFAGSLKYCSYAGVDIASQMTHSHVWERTAQCIRQDHDDDLWLGFMHSGSGFIEQNGHATHISTGDIVIYDAARIFRYQYQTQDMHIIRLPRSWIARRAPQTENLAGTVLNNQRLGISTIKHMILEAVSEPFEHAPGLFTEGFAESLFEVITLALRNQAELPVERQGGELYQRMQRFIKDNLHDNSLSLTSLAQAHHVSTRTVTRIFAMYDQSPMHAVWQARLQACRRLLNDGTVRNITELALDHGFSDVSHFSQAFKKSFGLTPTSLIQRKP